MPQTSRWLNRVSLNPTLLSFLNAKLESIKDIGQASKPVERMKKEYEKENEMLRAENKKLRENQLMAGNFKVKATVNQLWRESILLRNSNVTFCNIICNAGQFGKLEPL